jgi:hypothetical protein
MFHFDLKNSSRRAAKPADNIFLLNILADTLFISPVKLKFRLHYL